MTNECEQELRAILDEHELTDGSWIQDDGTGQPLQVKLLRWRNRAVQAAEAPVREWLLAHKDLWEHESGEPGLVMIAIADRLLADKNRAVKAARRQDRNSIALWLGVWREKLPPEGSAELERLLAYMLRDEEASDG